MHDNLMIIGANGHGKVVADIARCMGCYRHIGFLDDNPDIKEVMSIPVQGSSSDIDKFCDNCDMFVAIGNPAVRERLLEQLWEMGAEVPTLIHPKAILGSNVSLGSGTVVMAGAVVNPEVIIGRGCIINTSASVDHDCVIEDYAHIAVGAHLAGNVRVGRSTWIGAGSVIKNNIDICSGCMIGAGAAVVKNISENGIHVGVPVDRISIDKQVRGKHNPAYTIGFSFFMSSFSRQKACQGGVR